MPQAKPNVIVFFTDQQRWDTTGVHGNPLALTPNFDTMARRGTDVHYSFTCQPVCGPARACLQTGAYPTTIGCHRNSLPLPQDAKTLAHHFKEGGYQTAYIGKWHLASVPGKTPDQANGDYFRSLGQIPVPVEERGGYDYWLAANMLEFASDAYDTVLHNADNEAVKLPGYRVDALTDAAIRYVDEAQTQADPFYLFLSFLEPHHQNHRDDYPAPDGYQQRYEGQWVPPDLEALGGTTRQQIAGYYGMVKRLDEALGRLLDALRSLDLLDNTIVLFTTDHGNHFKTRNREYKRSCHEASIRLPTAVQGPGFEGGGRIPELTSLIDIPPTLLDAAGLPIPAEMQGRSFLPLVHGQQVEDWPDDIFVQISESQVGRAIRTKRWKYGVTAPDKDGNHDAGSDHYVEQYLYDLQADPHELFNLVGFDSHRAVADVLCDRLIKRMVAAGEDTPTIAPAEAIQDSDQRRVTTAEAMS